MFSCLRWKRLNGGARTALIALTVFDGCILLLVVVASVLAMAAPGSLLLFMTDNDETASQTHGILSTYTRLFSTWPW
jgi:hypothetical protein